MDIDFDIERLKLIGLSGELQFPADDKVIRRLAMLIEGECGERAVTEISHKYGCSRQRYYQLKHSCEDGGVLALQDHKRGPKTAYRRNEEAVRRIIRFRFLDPDMSADLIAQKLRQQGCPISTRSVQRVITEYGLQKKTPPTEPETPPSDDRHSPNPAHDQ